jgi:two-component system, NarL family, response regulator LiaR
MSVIKVAIFEDNDQLCEMLSQMIALSDDVQCTGAFKDANNIENKMQVAAPDVVLMDIDMPGVNGIEAVKIINDKFPAVLIMMQTVFEDSEKVFDSIRAGANGYLLKNSLNYQLIPAIRELMAGGAPMSAGIAKKVLDCFRQQSPYIKKEEYKLSEREKQILECLTQGMSYKIIADACFISLDTVKFHLKNIYDKLHVNSKSEAVIKAMKYRLI